MKKTTYFYGVALAASFMTESVNAKQNIQYEKDIVTDAAISCNLSTLEKYANNDSIHISTMAERFINDCSASKNTHPKNLTEFSLSTGDVTPPSFHSFGYSVSAINVDTGNVSVEISLTLFDEDSEIKNAGLYLDSPEGFPTAHSKNIYFVENDWVAGTDPNTYTAKETIVFDNTDAAGKWSARIWVRRDTSDNVEFDDVTAEDIVKAGFNPYLTVINSTAVDVTAPSFHSLNLSETTLDVSTDSRTVDVTLTLFDEGSKVKNASLKLLQPKGAPDSHSKYISFYGSDWTEGTLPNTYTAKATVAFDKTDIAGEWAAEIGIRGDNNNNSDYSGVTSDEIKKAGSNPYLTIVNTNSVDVTPPSFHSLKFSTSSADVSAESKEVDLTVTLFDLGSSIASAGIYIKPPEGSDNDDSKSVYLFGDDWKAGKEPNTYTATESVLFEDTDTLGEWYAEIWAMADTNENNEFDDVTAAKMEEAGSNPYLTILKVDTDSFLPDCASTRTETTCNLELNKTFFAKMDTAGDRDFYRIDIPEAGLLSVSTGGGLDSFGVLYDGNGNYVTADNNSGDNKNFSFSYDVEVGSYYLLVREYQKALGTYEISTKLEMSQDCASTQESTACSIGLNSSIEAKMDEKGDRDVYEVIVTEAGTLSFSTTGQLDTFGVLYPKGGNYLTADNNSGEGSNFSLSYDVEPGTYYILVREYHKAVGDYKLTSSFNK